MKDSPNELIFLYGPPGSGKSTIGPLLGKSLELPFYDIDKQIEQKHQLSISDIFLNFGESKFRDFEKETIIEFNKKGPGVIALGGGALIDPVVRGLIEESGIVICLNGSKETLLSRLANEEETRPLLITDGYFEEKLNALLASRESHYQSFTNQLETTGKSKDELTWLAQTISGMFRVRGMGNSYDVRVHKGWLRHAGEIIQSRGTNRNIAVVTDELVKQIYLPLIQETLTRSGFIVHPIILPSGEKYKTIQSIQRIWNKFLDAGLDRSSVAIALGGGVIGDLTGFASATFLRGIKWIYLPTTVLSMVDASLGGKTGIDLKQGKNLVGAFHAPSLVIVDPEVLASLPKEEIISGLAEVIKHGVIGDSELFKFCQQGLNYIVENFEFIIKKAMAVKIKIIEEDPKEMSSRVVLNFGHTIGHALEKVENYRIRHGEAIAIGMKLVTLYAERIGKAEKGMTELLTMTLHNCGLPTEIPGGIDITHLLQIIKFDKKRTEDRIRFTLPIRIGQVIWGYEVDPIEILTMNDVF